MRPGAERKADSKRQIFNRLSQRGPAGQVVTVPESAGGVGIQCRIPVSTVEGVIGPIPPGEWALKQIKTDLLADGHRVAFFFFFFFFSVKEP